MLIETHESQKKEWRHNQIRNHLNSHRKITQKVISTPLSMANINRTDSRRSSMNSRLADRPQTGFWRDKATNLLEEKKKHMQELADLRRQLKDL